MRRLFVLTLVLALTLLGGTAAQATQIGPGGFVSPTIIDFETAPAALIGGFYSGLGVTFAHLSGGNIYDTGTGSGPSYTASNFFDEPGFPAGEAFFSSPITRAGFYITTNSGDNTTVSAYLGSVFVGSELFVTGGGGGGGSFAGVEFLGGFDRLVVDPADNINGAMAIDDFRFEGSPVPDAGSSLLLLGMSLAGLRAWRKRLG